MVMGIPLVHRQDVFHRNINWPYGDWMFLSKFTFRHVLIFLCITFFRRHSLFMYQLCLLRRLWHLICTCSVRAGEGCGISSGTCSLGGGEECGISGMWWSRDGENISPTSTTRSKFGRGRGGEEAINIMSRLCQRMNCHITSPSNTRPSGVA